MNSDTLLRALAVENEMLARELGRAQRRFTQWRDDGAAEVARLEAELLRTRAACIVRDTRIAVLRDAVEAAETANAKAVAPTKPAKPAPAEPLSVAARGVLCVGGRSRQTPVYRELVERHGGRFEHVPGTADGCPHRLEDALAAADLVILQAGYVCQGACSAVEAHCARTGKRCVWLDKPCAIGFARSLAMLASQPAA